MKKALLGIALIAIILLGTGTSAAEDFSLTGLGGYKGGTGFRLAGAVSNFAQGFPLSIEVGVTYVSLDPGRALDVRKIFINNNTNGTPEKSGWIWGFHLDFLFPVHGIGLPNAQFYLGVRRSMFTGDFVYVGGNEDFEVTCNAWGVGTGLRTTFPIARSLGLMLSGGLDYYPNTTLSGHDTYYTPENDNVNEKEEFQYPDADNAVNQPKLQPMMMVGLTYRF
jgi:hypothetical protein